MPYFAAALARTSAGWTGEELDLSEVEDLEQLADLLRDLTGEGPGPALMLLDEDDDQGCRRAPRERRGDRRARTVHQHQDGDAQ